MLNALPCSYTSLCAGCDWLLKPYEEQRALKISHLREHWDSAFSGDVLLPEVEWVAVDRGELRDRVDLMVDSRSGGQKLGLFDRFKTGLVDLQGCPQMSSALESWFRDVRRIPFPIDRGSLRLRVSPEGTRGIWLDLANIDVKRLLDERSTLDQLREMSIVEIGQRRKRLVERDAKLKLDEPVLAPWFETYIEQGDGERAIPLYCTIGSFTQPGFRANHTLVKTVRDKTRSLHVKRAAEFGSGIGNFTLPLASVCDEVLAYEIDSLALQGLTKSLEEQNLSSKVQIHSGNFHAERNAPSTFGSCDLVLVDPPRSGFMNFLNPIAALETSQKPLNLVYVSCFTESFVQDSLKLASWGYEVQSISIVDQFPQSRHYEIVASFRCKI